MIILVRLCLLPPTPSKLQSAGRLILALGVIKLCLGVLLITVLFPVCPSSCQFCQGVAFTGFYPFIVMFLGVLWIVRGYRFLRLSKTMIPSTPLLPTNTAGIPVATYAEPPPDPTTPTAVVVVAADPGTIKQ